MTELHKYSKRFVAKSMSERTRRELKVILGILMILVGLAAIMTEWT